MQVYAKSYGRTLAAKEAKLNELVNDEDDKQLCL